MSDQTIKATLHEISSKIIWIFFAFLTRGFGQYIPHPELKDLPFRSRHPWGLPHATGGWAWGTRPVAAGWRRCSCWVPCTHSAETSHFWHSSCLDYPQAHREIFCNIVNHPFKARVLILGTIDRHRKLRTWEVIQFNLHLKYQKVSSCFWHEN